MALNSAMSDLAIQTVEYVCYLHGLKRKAAEKAMDGVRRQRLLERVPGRAVGPCRRVAVDLRQVRQANRSRNGATA